MARTKDRARQTFRTEVPAEGPVKVPVFRTATYARLSVDSSVSESDSITSQQMLMRDYIKGRDEFCLVREYKDDGISGTGFERQAFERLLGEVRRGNINCIIVKDFSRFGRNHIEVGNYLEKVFPFLGVRFISINDGYDSYDRDCGDKKLAVILKNLVNEYIAKDTSLKVASVYAAKQECGEYDGGRAPYGYAFADKRKTGFVVDKGPAEIVRSIFAWTIQGEPARSVVRRLAEGGVNPPKVYQDTGEFYRKGRERGCWNEVTINAILQNMAYTGHMALHKWKESRADGIGPHRLDESEWKIRKNTHEAIVTEDDFSLAQEILKARKERYKRLNTPDENIIRPENLLKGKVFCGDCLVPASRMGVNYQRKMGDAYGRVRIYRYRCRTYREKGGRECTSKSVSEKELEEIVHQAVAVFLCQAEWIDGVVSYLHAEYMGKMRRSLEKEKRMEEIAIRREKNEKLLLYEEYSRAEWNRKGGDLDGGNKERYLREKRRKEEEIRCHEERKAQLEEKTQDFECREKEQAGKIKEMLTDSDILPGGRKGELTGPMVSIFVDRVLLYEGKRVEIVMNFKNELSFLGERW